MTKPSRIDHRFAALKAQGRKGFVAFITAGDPDYETSREILIGLEHPLGHVAQPPLDARAIRLRVGLHRARPAHARSRGD